MTKIDRNEGINMTVSFDKIVSHLKQSGFVYQGSEIYGGLSNTWDFGPLGVELKDNIKKAWWQKFIQEDPNNVGIQAAILMNPEVWVATGHLANFSDPLLDCKKCKSRHRADKLIEDWAAENDYTIEGSVDAWSKEDMEKFTGDSFRDLTRIARINDLMWSELFVANKEALLSQMNLFLNKFEELKQMLESEDVDGMRKMMRHSTERRALFDKK